MVKAAAERDTSKISQDIKTVKMHLNIKCVRFHYINNK